MKPNWPLKVVPPSVDCSTVLTEPKPAFDVASYAFPVAYSWLPYEVVQVADTGTTTGIFELLYTAGMIG